MSFTYKIGGLNIISINEIPPSSLQKLSEAMRQARNFVKDALLKTQQALQVIYQARSNGLRKSEAFSLVNPTFADHLTLHFRTTKASEAIGALQSLNEGLQTLAAGMSSPSLRLAEYGYHWGSPDNAVAYVQMPVSWVFSSNPAPNDCLNTNSASFKNENDVNLRFDKIPSQSMEYLADTLIHECTHKFLGTYDLCKGGLSFKSVEPFLKDCAGMGIAPPLGPLAPLTAPQALRDAYVITNYIHYCPDVDLVGYGALAMQTHLRGERAIGGATNHRVFDSIGNDDL